MTSSQTRNAALQGFAEADSDGIIQVSLGTALYLSGNAVQSRFAGSTAPVVVGKPAENAMAARVVEVAQMLGSAGRAMR